MVSDVKMFKVYILHNYISVMNYAKQKQKTLKFIKKKILIHFWTPVHVRPTAIIKNGLLILI